MWLIRVAQVARIQFGDTTDTTVGYVLGVEYPEKDKR